MHTPPDPAQLASFRAAFAATCRGADERRFYETFFFGDNEQMANELAGLVLRGIKKATASAWWVYQAEGQSPPQPGDLSIVTDWSGRPLCVIETQSVEVMPFCEVTADFAAAEGEGDGSLAFWQQAHRDFFSRECAAAGQVFSEQMQVVCERFAMVYRPEGGAAPATGG